MRTFKLKNILLIGVLLIEVVIFSLAYLFGNSGIRQLKLSKLQNDLVLQEVNKLKTDIENLEKKLQNWELDSFHKEKIARERLHMSKSNEQIYYLV